MLVVPIPAVAMPASARPASTWTVETVATGGGWPDAAYGPSVPGIAYTLASDNSVRYAYRDSAWHTEFVATGVFSGSALPQLTFDSNGDAWILYDQIFPSGVRLGHRTGPNTWTFPLSISNTDPADLQLAPDGSLALLYEDTTTGMLVYATYDGTTLTPSPIAPGSDGSLTFNGSTPVVAFEDGTGGLSFAERPVSTWNVTSVAPSTNARPSVAVLPAGTSLMSYGVGNTDSDLLIAREHLNSWQSRPVDTRGNTGLESSLRIVAGSEPLVVYKRLNSNVTQARVQAASFLGGTWTISVVYSDASVMGHPSLVVGSDDVPHVALAGSTALLWATRV